MATQQPENIALLRKQLELNESQVLAALDVIAENDIPLELLVVKLVEIAERFKALQERYQVRPATIRMRLLWKPTRGRL